MRSFYVMGMVCAGLILSGAQLVAGQDLSGYLERKEPKPKSFSIPFEDRAAGTISNTQQFDALVRYRLAEFTLHENATRLPELTRNLRTLCRVAASTPGSDADRRLKQLLVSEISEMVADPRYSPPARVNLVLLLAGLNSKELAIRQEPVPLTWALPKLVDVAKFAIDPPGDAAAGTPIEDAVAANGLVGILRHAKAGIEVENYQRVVIDAMRQLVQQPCPKLREAGVHEWLQRKSVEILGELGQAGLRPGSREVADELAGVVRDPDTSLGLKCEAAAALSRLDFAGTDRKLPSWWGWWRSPRRGAAAAMRCRSIAWRSWRAI